MSSTPIVLDFGTSTIRSGFGGDSEPYYVFPSTGPKKKTDTSSSTGKKYSSKINQSFISPVFNRTVTNFDDFQILLNDLFQKEMKIQTEQHPCLYADSPLNPIENREKIFQVFMETYNFASVCPTFSSALALYNAGLTSGIVVDSGENVTDVVPVFECFTLAHNISRVHVGGKTINSYLKRLLNEQNVFLKITSETQTLTELKEQLCFIRGEPHPDDDIEKDFLSSDGSSYHIGRLRYQCCECLFNPSLVDCKDLSLPKAVAEVIRQTDDDIRDVLSSKVLISGGTSLLPGFIDRIQKGVLIYNQTTSNVDFNVPANRKNAVWVGGSILSCVETFKDISITKREYDEQGLQILKLKTY